MSYVELFHQGLLKGTKNRRNMHNRKLEKEKKMKTEIWLNEKYRRESKRSNAKMLWWTEWRMKGEYWWKTKGLISIIFFFFFFHVQPEGLHTDCCSIYRIFHAWPQRLMSFYMLIKFLRCILLQVFGLFIRPH